ncbi:hypothetical protein MKX01_022525 [Papaver californicum]|nr:hypothetical protein MKX01_022525 [Papaver californicum]
MINTGQRIDFPNLDIDITSLLRFRNKIHDMLNLKESEHVDLLWWIDECFPYSLINDSDFLAMWNGAKVNEVDGFVELGLNIIVDDDMGTTSGVSNPALLRYSTPKKIVSKSTMTLRRSPRIAEQSKTKEIVGTQASFGDDKVKGKGVDVYYGIEDDVFWGQACTQAYEDECHPIDDPGTPMDDEDGDDMDLPFAEFLQSCRHGESYPAGKSGGVTTHAAGQYNVNYDSGEEGELFPEIEEVEDIPDGEVRVGLQFSDNLDFKMFLRQYAVRNQLQYKFLKSDSLRIRVVSKFKETYNCGFFIYARKLPRVKTFKIRGFSDNHNCIGDKLGRNGSANPGFVATHVLEKMKISTTAEIPKARQIKDEFWTSHNTDISYNVAWRARNIVLEMRNGSYDDSYRLVPSMVEMINRTNPGSVANFTYER